MSPFDLVGYVVKMRLGVPKEPDNETRVAIVPSSMKKLLKAGFEVLVEQGAGISANGSNVGRQTAGHAHR